MVLHHVADDAERRRSSRRAADADVLLPADLDAADELAVPERLEDEVGEAQDQQVLDEFLAEVVVDPVDLPLAEDVDQLPGHHVRRRPVAAERLLDDHARPAAAGPAGHQARVAEGVRDVEKNGRRDGQVEQAVDVGGPRSSSCAWKRSRNESAES